MYTKRQKISLLLSLLINILLVGEFIYSEMFRTTTKALILFIPFGIITCILFLWNFCTKNPNHKPIHIAKYYFLWGFILFFQIIFILILEIQIASQPYQSDETPLWTYPVALNIRYKKQTGYYFPHKIPKTAKNITYTEYYPNEFTIAFNIDKNYIDNEIKKLKPKRTVTTSANGNAVCKDY